MCYLVAKDVNKHGCIALKTKHGKHLVELKKSLVDTVGRQGLQFITISRPMAYGEYAPYVMAVNEEDFKFKVKAM